MSVVDSPENDDDRSEGLLDQVADYYEDHPRRFWLIVTLGPIVVLWLGVQLAPEIFWDRFLWENLWGPIVADAHGRPMCSAAPGQWHPTPCQGAEVAARTGYTPTSYAVYGPVLGLAIFGLHDFLRRYDFEVGGRFFLGLAPLIVFGSLLRVMEDTALFEPPVQYLFISPLIYFTLAGITVGALGLGLLARRVRASRGVPAALTVLAVPTMAFLLLYIAVELVPGWSDGFAYVPPGYVVLFVTLVGFALVAIDTWGRDDVDPLVVAFGVGLVGLLLVLYNSAWWIVGEPWSAVGIGRTFITDVLPLTLVGALAITFGVTAVFWLLSRSEEGFPNAHVFLGGIAIAILFGHALDAWATTIALKNPVGIAELGAYSEKHPASNFLIQELGWPVWIGVKVLLAVLIVYMLDVEYERDFEDRPQLEGLIKLAIMVLGLGPGIRDVGRVVLGV